MDGVINIYKEKGFTSFDVVAKMRGILHTKKIGHTGTLDPDATGVLPVCVGRATKLVSMMENHDKTYQARMLLGCVTDTQDLSGKILATAPVDLSEEKIYEAGRKFTGPQMQIPPMYSALKVNGKKLYEYAREGKVIEREARPIEVHSLSIDEIKLPYVTMTISCSKGTYIRTICHDMGEWLGCGACMDQLTRTRVAGFHLENAITLTELEALVKDGRLEEKLITLEEVFSGLPFAKTKGYGSVLAHNGNRLRAENFDICGNDGMINSVSDVMKGKAICSDRIEIGQDGLLDGRRMIRVYDEELHFLGIYEEDKKRHDWKPYQMFL